jgi:hypothetical protein
VVGGAVSAEEAPRRRGGQYDPALRRRSVRGENGCWVYIPAVELEAAGFLYDSPPWYRTLGYGRSRNAGSVIVSLYREP